MNYPHELLLTADRRSWQVPASHGTESDKKKLSLWKKIWERDNYTCYFCNFKSNRFQEIHHLNDDHNDDRDENLVTICPLCHQTFHLNLVSTTNNGTIVWLPELSQQDLNHLVRALFVAMEPDESNDPSSQAIQKTALQIYQSIEARAKIMETNFQNNSSEPGQFGQALLNLNKETYNKRFEFIDHFKLLHRSSRFPVQIRYWKKYVYKDLPLNTWRSLIKI